MTSAKNDLTRNAAETRKNYTESIPARIRAAAPDIGTIARTLSGIRETIGTLTDTRGNIDPDALTTAALEQIRDAFIRLTDGINNRLFIDRYDREHPEQRKTSPETLQGILTMASGTVSTICKLETGESITDYKTLDAIQYAALTYAQNNKVDNPFDAICAAAHQYQTDPEQIVTDYANACSATTERSEK